MTKKNQIDADLSGVGQETNGVGFKMQWAASAIYAVLHDQKVGGLAKITLIISVTTY